MEIWLARHGETVWNAKGRYTGTADVPLTDAGVEQGRALGKALSEHRFAVVYSSPLRRALETARLAGFDDPLVDPLLTERDFGDYEGRTKDEIRRERPDWDPWRQGYPGGEDLDAVGTRADRFLSVLPGAGDDVLVFGHSQMLRVLTVRHMGLDAIEARHLSLDGGTISVLGMSGDWPALRRWNVPVSNSQP